MSDKLTEGCIQCGKCGGVCPIGRVDPRISPRKTLFRIMQDTGKRLDEDKDELWMCVTCYACDEICPQGIRLVDVMFESRNNLCKSGEKPDNIEKMINTLKENGTATSPTTRGESIRKALGLDKPRKPRINEILGIIDL